VCLQVLKTLEPGSAVALEVANVLSVGDQVIPEWTSRATARGGALPRPMQPPDQAGQA
jgi:hypothetical protein